MQIYSGKNVDGNDLWYFFDKNIVIGFTIVRKSIFSFTAFTVTNMQKFINSLNANNYKEIESIDPKTLSMLMHKLIYYIFGQWDRKIIKG